MKKYLIVEYQIGWFIFMYLENFASIRTIERELLHTPDFKKESSLNECEKTLDQSVTFGENVKWGISEKSIYTAMEFANRKKISIYSPKFSLIRKH